MKMKRIAALALAALLALLAAGAMAATTPKVYKDGVELTDLYNSGTKRLTIRQLGTYTIKDWYGAAPGDPTVGEIYIAGSLSGDVVLNLENVCLTNTVDEYNDGIHIITNRDRTAPSYSTPEKLHLTVNFDGKSSLNKGNSKGNCINIISEHDGKVTLKGAKPTLSAYSDAAVYVWTKYEGAASIAVEGVDADLSSSSGAVLRTNVSTYGGRAKVTVSGENAKITSTSGDAIFCFGSALAEVEISGDGAVITGGQYGIKTYSVDDTADRKIVLSAAAVISSSTGGSAVEAGSLTVKGCALFASKDDSQLLGDASSGELIGKAQGKAYLRTARVHPGGVGDVGGAEPQPEDADAADLPKTGDSSSLALWAGLLALSALALSRARRRA